MKKVLALVLTMILAIASFTMIASAAPSPQTNGAVIGASGIDKNNSKITFVISKPATGVDTKLNTEVTSLSKKDNVNYTVLDIVKITATEINGVSGESSAAVLSKVKFPVAISFNVTGVTAKDTGFFLLTKDDGTVVKVAAKFADGVMSGDFDAIGDVAVVVNKSTTGGSTGDDTSPKTSDSATPVVCLVLFTAVAVAGYSIKKIKTEA